MRRLTAAGSPRTDNRIRRSVPLASCLILALGAFLASSPDTACQPPGGPSLTWQQRLLGILPLVKPNPKDPVVVTVNGAPVTAAEIRYYAKTEARLANANTAAETSAVYSDATRNLIDRELLLGEARRRGVRIADAEVAERAREFKVEALGGETISAGGAPDSLLLDRVRDSMEIEKMLDAEFLKHKVAPTEPDIRKYYAEHKDLFIKDLGEVRLSHIAVKLPQRPAAAEKADAWRKIRTLRDEAQKTADFAALARKSSEDAESAPKGGDLGYFRKGQLPPVVDKLAFSTPVGQLSPIIESSLGLSFFKVTERQSASYAPLEAVRAKIAMALLQYSQEYVVKRVVKKLAKGATIKFNKLPSDPGS